MAGVRNCKEKAENSTQWNAAVREFKGEQKKAHNTIDKIDDGDSILSQGKWK